MLLEFGTAVRYTEATVRAMVADRANREKLMRMRGMIHAFLPRGFVEVDFDGQIVRLDINQIEAV